MRIDYIRLQNFKGFEAHEQGFHPELNLIIGVNGTGKTSLLDALAVAAGSWFLGFQNLPTRQIASDEIRLKAFGSNEVDDPTSASGDVHWEPQGPCVIEAEGAATSEHVRWKRTRNPGGRTTSKEAKALGSLAEKANASARSGEGTLPLIAYYGTGRLWNVPRERAKIRSEAGLTRKSELSRLTGYRHSLDPRISVSDLAQWFARQSWIAFQQGRQNQIFSIVREALVRCVDGASNIYFDASYGEMIVTFEGGETLPFNALSDGQKVMLAMVGDMAQKAAVLNPRLGDRALAETPGIVLIDELDLHLHPTWQRKVIEDLRTTFPAIQFFCTTHSPFLIQSLRSGEELVVLDGQPTAKLGDLSINQIARGIQGVSNPDVSARYEEMKDVARTYLETLEEASMAPEEKLIAYKERLAESIDTYADNPAFQAFLEERVFSTLI